MAPGQFEYTIYSDGTNFERGIFYYTTYSHKQITRVDLHHENLDADNLIAYPINEQIDFADAN